LYFILIFLIEKKKAGYINRPGRFMPGGCHLFYRAGFIAFVQVTKRT